MRICFIGFGVPGMYSARLFVCGLRVWGRFWFFIIIMGFRFGLVWVCIDLV